jgi:hypothetical protein
MHRLIVVLPLVALVVVASTGMWHPTSFAQVATPPAEQEGIGGSWIITATVTDQGDEFSFVNFSTFMPGGGLVTTAPDSPLGHGAWELSADGTYALTMIFPDFDDDEGALEGQAMVRATVTLDPDGNTFTGPFLTEISDDAGDVLFSYGGTAQGQRIEVVPLGTPQAGTPESATAPASLTTEAGAGGETTT